VSRIGVVGVGSMGRNHARVLATLPDCELVGITDVDRTKADRVAIEHGCAALESLDDLLERVDGVCVAVPTVLHHEVGLACLEAGVDVLVEKPIATTLDEADELIAAAQRHGRQLQVGHVERYNPAVEALESLVCRPAFIDVERLGSFAPRGLEVDVVLDLMIHDIDVLHSIVDDDVRDIRAVGVPVLSDQIDIANARVEFAGGAIANMTASRVSIQRTRKVRIFQPEAYFSVDYTTQRVNHFVLHRAPGQRPSIGGSPVEVREREPLVGDLADFVASVRDRTPPRVDGAAGRRALATALEVRDSIERHRTLDGMPVVDRPGRSG
jgi:predicted dehydrogenase